MAVIAVTKETRGGETRVAATPETVKKLAAAGFTVVVEAGAGTAASYPDADYEAAGAKLAKTAKEALKDADVLFKVRAPEAAEIAALKTGAIVAAALNPHQDKDTLNALAKAGASALAMEFIPRITRAQVMDMLSSQANLGGYRAVIEAAEAYGKALPMMMTAAGTVAAAKVFVMGVGVAGLQAIATAKRLGAMVSGYDVRPETKEQIESLGAKFVDTGVSAAGAGGYARELTDEEKRAQADKLGKAIADCDALITTAAIPGKKAPLIVTAEMVARMKPGSVVVDMAAESGGNVAGTQAGEKTLVGETLVIGPVNIPSRMPVHASEMYAKNLYNFISPFIKDGVLSLDWEDEVLAGACLTHAGEIRHAGVKAALGL